MPEVFGLGAALVVMGRSVLSACLVVPDRLGRARPKALARIQAWAAAEPLVTTTGPKPWRVAMVSEFFDPYAGVEGPRAKPWSFQPTAYAGAGFVVGADLGRVFGLAAEHIVVPRGRRAGSFELWLPGWAVRGPSANVRARSPHRPCLYVRARKVGWQAEWGAGGKDGQGHPGGKRDGDGRPWRGLFVDVLSAGYAFDADRGASFAEHCENFGLEPADVPLAVDLDERGAQAVTHGARAVP